MSLVDLCTPRFKAYPDITPDSCDNATVTVGSEYGVADEQVILLHLDPRDPRGRPIPDGQLK